MRPPGNRHPEALLLALPLLLLLLGGCAGEVKQPIRHDGGGDAPPHWVFNEAGVPVDTKPPPGKEASIPPDHGPPDPCSPFASAGQSCAGGQSCPAHLQPAALGTKPCTCYVSCDPGASKFCAPLQCDHICIQLYDSQQKPIPKTGVCIVDPGHEEGEPCSPAVCKQGLICTAHGTAAAFCRKTCKDPSECPAYKMVCADLSSPAKKICVPGGSTTGPKEGQLCAGPNDFCVGDTICDPGSKICLKACDPSKTTYCGAKTCTKLVDPGPQITVGYGCE
jgi:hypothetical protein